MGLLKSFGSVVRTGYCREVCSRFWKCRSAAVSVWPVCMRTKVDRAVVKRIATALNYWQLIHRTIGYWILLTDAVLNKSCQYKLQYQSFSDYNSLIRTTLQMFTVPFFTFSIWVCIRPTLHFISIRTELTQILNVTLSHQHSLPADQHAHSLPRKPLGKKTSSASLQ